MYIRSKRNASGSVSVQIVKKVAGKNCLVETVGCGRSSKEIELLEIQGKQRIKELNPQMQLDIFATTKDQIIHSYFNKESKLSITTIGPELVLGKIFDYIGFSKIPEDLFRDIVLARLVYPVSKLRTTEYLLSHKKQTVDVVNIYRFLDRFHKRYKAMVEEIAYSHTKRVLKKVAIVFYDMTTLYFESEKEDELRRVGYSKDGKFQHPQIMLGLLVGENGYPIGYDIFEGNTFEGKTLLPTIKKIQTKYGFDKPIIVADSALLSKNNIDSLIDEKYEFILGARLKSESNQVQTTILQLAQNISDQDCFVIEKNSNTSLIIGYSSSRAKKDAFNRERGLLRLNKLIKSSKLTKKQINNRGYNKFLNLDGNITISINNQKVEIDKKWDGLKGYITNSKLEPADVIKNYQHLWNIEKAFRISKTDLRIRPIYHRKKDRIEAHICIAFVAYSIYKELERILKINKSNLSAEKAIQETKTIYQLHYTLPDSQTSHAQLIGLNQIQTTLIQIVQNLL